MLSLWTAVASFMLFLSQFTSVHLTLCETINGKLLNSTISFSCFFLPVFFTSQNYRMLFLDGRKYIYFCSSCFFFFVDFVGVVTHIDTVCVVHRWLTDRLCVFVLVFQVSFFLFIYYLLLYFVFTTIHYCVFAYSIRLCTTLGCGL